MKNKWVNEKCHITYDLEDDKDSEEFEKEITKRKPEEVNIDPDSNT